MWLTNDPFWGVLYLSTTYYLPAFACAAFFFLLVLFTPKHAREYAQRKVLILFGIVLAISAVLFVAGLVLFLGFVLAPQVVLFLTAFLPSAGVAILLARFLRREGAIPGMPVRMGMLPFVHALGVTFLLVALGAGLMYAALTTMPTLKLPNFEETRKAVTLGRANELPAPFLTFVRSTEEFRTEVKKEEERYFKARKPFTYTNPEGAQILITSTQELKEFAPEKYKEFVEDYALKTLTAHEMYMPERLRAELPRFREEERIAYANEHAESIKPLLEGFRVLGLPSDLTPIQVADSLIRFAPQNSYRVEEVHTFVRGYTTCQNKRYFFIMPACRYKAGDGKVYRVVEQP